MESFFAKVKFFRFWPKTMDCNKAFGPKSWSFFVVLLLQNGRCYEAEICAILFLLDTLSDGMFFFAKVKLFRFWPKTMEGVLAEIVIILCGPFTPKWKVL